MSKRIIAYGWAIPNHAIVIVSADDVPFDFQPLTNDEGEQMDADLETLRSGERETICESVPVRIQRQITKR